MSNNLMNTTTPLTSNETTPKPWHRGQAIVTACAAKFFQALATQYDMPELGQAIPELVAGEVPHARVTVDVAPRGQLASIVATLEVTASLTYCDGEVLIGTLELRYKHIGGGSNGKDVRFLVNAQEAFGDWKFASMVEETAFNAAARMLGLR